MKVGAEETWDYQHPERPAFLLAIQSASRFKGRWGERTPTGSGQDMETRVDADTLSGSWGRICIFFFWGALGCKLNCEFGTWRHTGQFTLVRQALVSWMTPFSRPAALHSPFLDKKGHMKTSQIQGDIIYRLGQSIIIMFVKKLLEVFFSLDYRSNLFQMQVYRKIESFTLLLSLFSWRVMSDSLRPHGL